MILNFYFISDLLWYSLIIIFFFNFFTWSNTGYFNWLDVLSRLHVNDFFLNTYYYFWTTFWYIPVLVFVTLYLITFLSNLTFNNIESGLTTLLLLALMCEYTDYFFLNPTYTQLILNSESINLLLTNSINKYHPYLFYTSLGFFFSYYFIFLNHSIFSNVNFYSTTLLKLFTGTSFIFLNVITLTLFLGAWWANQEGSWGGWWNWDPSEVFGLLVMIFTIFSLHKQFTNYNFITLFYDMNYIIYFMLLVYIFIQLNFNLVSHNFGINVDQFVNTSQLFIILLCFIFLLVYNLNNRLYSSISILLPQIRIFTTSKSSILFTTITLLTLMIITLSFLPLLNEFFWNFWSINLFNFTFKFSTNILYIYVICVGYFFKLNTLYLLLYVSILLATTNLNVVLLFFLFLIFSYSSVIHFLLTLFLLLNVVTESTTYLNWSNMSNLSLSNLGNIITDWNLSLFSLNNLDVEILFIENWNNLIRDIIWNFYNLNSSFEVHTFVNQLSLSFSNQSLLVGSFLNLFSVQLFDQNLFLIFFLFILMLLSLNLFFNNPLLIIF